MSLYESGDSSGGVSLKDLSAGQFVPGLSAFSIGDYAFLVCRGGWPLSVGQEKDVALQQAKTFFEGLVAFDLYSLKDVVLQRNEARARKLLRAYARNSASQASNASLMADMAVDGEGINHVTFGKYMDALGRLYVTDELESWNPNLRSKTAIRQANTRHFVDPSIAAVALGLTPDSLFADMKTFGLLFESLAVRDLRIYAEAIGARVLHYRDKAGREADAVIVYEDGSYALVEIKLGDPEEIKEAGNKLLSLSQDIAGYSPEPRFRMAVTAGKAAYMDGNGTYVVPLGMLRP